jgi:hypothetical protein
MVPEMEMLCLTSPHQAGVQERKSETVSAIRAHGEKIFILISASLKAFALGAKRVVPLSVRTAAGKAASANNLLIDMAFPFRFVKSQRTSRAVRFALGQKGGKPEPIASAGEKLTDTVAARAAQLRLAKARSRKTDHRGH